MEAYYMFLNDLVNRNRQEYSGEFQVQWLNPYAASEFEVKRLHFLNIIGDHTFFKSTKPYANHISNGCKLCGEGQWSCLFITNQCNANCFYCPTAQSKDEIPGTQNLTFETAEAYAEYINHFGFKGVSFSGGEPLLYFDRVINYLAALRQSCAPDLYVWMYTNGILADEEKFKQCAKLGLNEVRFDIGATNYKIDKIAFAKGVIPNITVEIPAVPEEKDQLIELLPQLIEMGVTNINLHQLRLTKYNYKRLVSHNYTYIPAERPLVMESELAALEIIAYVKEHQLPIGINYCSFHYKNRFQKAGYRKMIAEKFIIEGDEITENGFLRVKTNNQLSYERMHLTDFSDDNLLAASFDLVHKKYNIERVIASSLFDVDSQLEIDIQSLMENGSSQIPNNETMFKIWQKEFIEEGLREY